MKHSTKQFVIAVLIFDAIVSSCNVIYFIQRETPLDRTYRARKDCGLMKPEIDQLIDNAKISTLTAKEQIKL